MHIDTSNHKFFKQTRKVKEAAVLVGWINDGFYEKSEFVGNLPIKHNLTIVSRPGIEIEIGKTIAETFKINLACK